MLRVGAISAGMLVSVVYADDVASYTAGQTLASATPKSLIGSKSDVPGYTTDSPAEAGLGHEGLQDRAHGVMAGSSQEATFFQGVHGDKVHMPVRSDDALIQESDRILSDPAGALEEIEVDEEAADEDKETITCTEPSDPEELEVIQHVDQVPGVERKRVYVRTDRNDGGAATEEPPEPREWSVEVAYDRVVRYAAPWEGFGDPRGGAWYPITERAIRHEPRHAYPVYDFYERPVRVDVSTGAITPTGDWERVEEGYTERAAEFGERVKEHIHLKELTTGEVTWSSLAGFEEALDRGDCEEVSVTCVEGPETRTIAGKEVHQECWAYRYNYRCQGNTPDTCSACRGRANCRQVSSTCARRVAGRCVAFTQTFECTRGLRRFRRVRLTGDHPFCMDGSCHKVAWTPNGDFAHVMSRLNVLQEASKEMDHGSHVVFKGKHMSCVRHRLGHKNCCNKTGGWGGRCSAAELAHQIPRREGKCVRIGTFVAEKERITKVWLRKKTSFCCFGSKLSRIIQEQGRAQLGIGWGDPRTPSCRALSFDELSRIDFDRLNLSELLSEVMARVRVPDAGNVARDLVGDWRARLEPSPADGADAAASAEPAIPAEAPQMRRLLDSRRAAIEAAAPREHTTNHDGDPIPGGEHAQLVF